MSYPVPTPSAMRGVFEAVFWKPQMRWQIERIHVLNPVKWQSFRRNEVTKKASAPSAKVIASGGEAPVLWADEERAQRNTVALRDVDYIVEARLHLTAKAGPEDSFTKYVEMFTRRLEKGQHFHQPYFGCRECIAHAEPVETTPPATIDVTEALGVMLWDIDFSQNKGRPANTPIFFKARMERGIIQVPPTPQAARATLTSTSHA